MNYSLYRIRKFLRDRRGAAAVEAALLVPIFVPVFVFTLETMIFLYSSVSVDHAVDNLGKLGWEMFRHGNWGSTVPVTNKTNMSYQEVPIWVVAATIEPKPSGAAATAPATAAVNWQYKRANLAAPIVRNDKKVVVPHQYYAPHEQLFLIYGELKSTMPYNLFGLWGKQVFFKSELKYMTPRNVSIIGLQGVLNSNCSKT